MRGNATLNGTGDIEPKTQETVEEYIAQRAVDMKLDNN
jgi:hypothetical protein